MHTVNVVVQIVRLLLKDHETWIVFSVRVSDCVGSIPLSVSRSVWLGDYRVLLVIVPSRIICLIKGGNAIVVLARAILFALFVLLGFDLSYVVVVSIVDVVYLDRLHVLHVMSEVRIEHLRAVSIDGHFAELQLVFMWSGLLHHH